MSYLKLFKNHNEYEEYKSSGIILPDVSHCINEVHVHYNTNTEPIKQNNIITYIASEKFAEITERTVPAIAGLHINEFNTEIKNHTFGDGIGTIEFYDDVTNIGYQAFYGCGLMTNIVIPSGVTSIGEYAFSNCSGLTNVNIPYGVASIGIGAFWHCSGIKIVDIPNGIESISNNTFTECYSLESVKIPNSIITIGGAAFSMCSGLTSIIIPNSVTTIGQSAFNECSGLSNIKIPNSVERIGSGAFMHCSGLTSIICEAATPPVLGGRYVFTNTNNCPIYVPNDSLNMYKSANYWSSYSNRIQAMQ